VNTTISSPFLRSREGGRLVSQGRRVEGRRLALSLAIFTATAPAYGADAAHGERLARRWCASCHVVASDQKGTVSEVPPFATIARNPDFDAAKVALFLLDPHPKMPNMNLSRAEAGDLAAYIKTLK
jgi:mono/diheme cytochrome c family protein